MKSSFTLGRLGGVPIRLHWTFFLALPYIAVAMAMQMTAADHARRLSLPPLAWGLLLAVLLFVSVVAHEFAHIAVARAYGARPKDVTLMLIGGVSRFESLPEQGTPEALMAAAGPFLSLLIALASWLTRMAFADAPRDISFGLRQLGEMNLAVGLFNLVPAYPLDGGRVLRSILSRRFGNTRGSVMAAKVGKVFAAIMGALGLLAGHVMLMFIALFVWVASHAEGETAMRSLQLRGLKVGSVARYDVPSVRAGDPVSVAVDWMLRSDRPYVLVMGSSPWPMFEPTPIRAAVLSADDIAPPGVFAEAAISDARSCGDLCSFDVPVVDDQGDLGEAFERVASSGARVAPVSRDGRVVGVIDLADVLVRARLWNATRAAPRPSWS